MGIGGLDLGDFPKGIHIYFTIFGILVKNLQELLFHYKKLIVDNHMAVPDMAEIILVKAENIFVFVVFKQRF